MIDYEKLKLSHELAEKTVCAILYAYKKSYSVPFVCWIDLDQLLFEMKELNKNNCKYKIGQKVWRLNDEDEPESFIISNIECYSEEKNWYFLDDTDNCWIEEQLYPTRESLIESQIEYWKSLKDKCEHESDGIMYTSNPPKLKCKKCGEFY